MNHEEALTIVENALHEERLSRLQVTVFRHAWDEQSYQAIAKNSGYEVGYVKQTGSQLWQILSKAFGEKVTKSNVHLVIKRKAKEGGQESGVNYHQPYPIQNSKSEIQNCQDWGDAPDVSVFYGRTQELATLQQWIVRDRCRLVGLFGMGGIGKTSISVKLAKQIQNEFEYVIWRSLRNAPPLQELLADLLQVLTLQQQTDLPDTLDGRILCLLDGLRRHRCLVVLDNVETILKPGDCGGGYQARYESYGQLLQCLGETNHQSTLVLTSREKPREIAAIEGKSLPMRSLRLTGLCENAVQEIFSVKGDFSGSAQEWKVLIEHYAGNPLALKMVACAIQDFFEGSIANFLDLCQEGTSIFGDIRDLLARQIDRLSDLEQQVMYWLAIDREPVTLSQLRADFVPQVSLANLLEALTSLERRSLIEKNRTLFTLQPVVMEYMTDRLIEQVCKEIWKPESENHRGSASSVNLQTPTPKQESHFQSKIQNPQSKILKTHALIKAQAKDYIRETQIRLILKPVADKLLSFSSKEHLENKFRQILHHLRLRGKPSPETGYIGGNVLNLLCQLECDLSGWDFSHLTVWQAYLNRVNLHHVNFSGANLAKSVFTETFSQVLSVAFSPDGKLLATGDVNHEIHVWQVETGKQLLTCKVDEGWIWSVAFSPDGRLFASSANQTVTLWNVQTGECVKTLRGYSDRVFSLAFSPDGRLLASGSEDHLVRIWDVKTGQLLSILSGHTDEIRCVAFSPQCFTRNLPIQNPHQALALGSLGTTAAKPNKYSKIPNRTSYLLASGSFDGTVRLWDANTGECLKILQGHTQRVWSVAFSPEGKTLASSSSDRMVKLWEVCSGHCLKSLRGHSQAIRTVAFSPEGKTLASGSDDCSIRLWNQHTGETLRVLNGHSSWISSVAFSPNSSLLASGSEDQSVRLWETHTNRCLKSLQGHSNGVWSVAFSPQGTTLASGSQDGGIRLWDSNTHKCIGHLQAHSSWIWSVVFAPNGYLLASSSEDRSIKLWDIRTRQRLRMLKGHQDAVFSIIFSPDGQTLCSGSLDGTVKLWDIRTGQCRQTLQGHRGGVWSISLSSDGKLLASASQDQTLKLWDVETGCCIKTLQGHQSWIRACAISPNQQLLVSGSADGIIKLWNINTGECYQTWQAHTGPVLSVAFNPDKRTFASSGADAMVKLWDVLLLQNCQILQGHDKWVRFLAYSPDGQILASCSQDETIKLWKVRNHSASMFFPNFSTLAAPTAYYMPWMSKPIYSADTTHQGCLWATWTTPASREHLRGLTLCQEDTPKGQTYYSSICLGECITTLRIPRPYEEMNITDVSGLTEAQKSTLKMLGAVGQKS